MSNSASDPEFWENRNKPRKRGVGVPTNNSYLDTNSSQDEKRIASEAVYEFLSDALFDKLSFISFPFTKTAQIYYMETDDITAIYSPSQWVDVPAAGQDLKAELLDDGILTIRQHYLNPVEGPVTDTARYWGISRIPNTSEGKFLSPGKKSRARCSFYTDNISQLDGYLLTPVVYDSFGQLNYFTSMDIFRAYAGLKFEAGKTYIAIKEADKSESLTEIDINLGSSGFSDTYRLDMVSTGKETDIYIDSLLIGSFSSDMVGTFNSTDTFLPLLCPAKSLDGSTVGITVENFQFIQDN